MQWLPLGLRRCRDNIKASSTRCSLNPFCHILLLGNQVSWNPLFSCTSSPREDFKALKASSADIRLLGLMLVGEGKGEMPSPGERLRMGCGGSGYSLGRKILGPGCYPKDPARLRQRTRCSPLHSLCHPTPQEPWLPSGGVAGCSPGVSVLCFLLSSLPGEPPDLRHGLL